MARRAREAVRQCAGPPLQRNPGVYPSRWAFSQSSGHGNSTAASTMTSSRGMASTSFEALQSTATPWRNAGQLSVHRFLSADRAVHDGSLSPPRGLVSVPLPGGDGRVAGRMTSSRSATHVQFSSFNKNEVYHAATAELPQYGSPRGKGWERASGTVVKAPSPSGSGGQRPPYWMHCLGHANGQTKEEETPGHPRMQTRPVVAYSPRQEEGAGNQSPRSPRPVTASP